MDRYRRLPDMLLGPSSPFSRKAILVPAGSPGLMGIVKIFSINSVVDLSSPANVNFCIFTFFIPPKNT